MSNCLKRIFLAVIPALFLFTGYCFAEAEDGFGAARKIEASHFIIYYAPQLEPSSLEQQLNIGSADKILAGRQDYYGTGLADMVDTLFARVCDILDMQLYSFKGNIKICQRYEQLNQIYSNLFDKSLQGGKSFFVYDFNTIYISSDNFKREILGHEIAHAIISHYFVVLPSIKIQEVLATYVEYQLRKSGQ